MAKAEHRKILLKHGVEAWNKWRQGNPDINPNLSEVSSGFSNFNFNGGNFRNTNLSRVNFNSTEFIDADFSNADLRESNFAGVSFDSATLTHAALGGARFFNCSFVNANLSFATLDNTVFTDVRLRGANFTGADLMNTIFLDTLLSEAKGLQKTESNPIIHLGIDSLSELHKLPKEIQQATFTDNLMIEVSKLYQKEISTTEVDDILYHIHDLLLGKSLQINPLFISYSHKDMPFVDVLDKKLRDQGLRVWRDIHDASSGRLEKVVSRAISRNPTVVLVLSKNSINSDWVQHEARLARELEIELKRDILCPIALDKSWENCSWPARLQEQIREYNILDFSNWKKGNDLDVKFRKLIEGLDLFYKVKNT